MEIFSEKDDCKIYIFYIILITIIIKKHNNTMLNIFVSCFIEKKKILMQNEMVVSICRGMVENQ